MAALVGAESPQPRSDLRSIELLRRDCRSEIGRHEVTLFANGTVRLREGIPQDPTMYLAELDPERLSAYERRLAAEDLGEVEERAAGGVEGEWVERCQLELRAEERVRTFFYARYDTLPLALSRVIAIADDLAREIDPLISAEHLPMDYVPRSGDVLRRADGELFRIVGQTGDKLGFELTGVVSPLTLYMPKSELRRAFVALVSREGKN
jgi:hypothetical protein